MSDDMANSDSQRLTEFWLPGLKSDGKRIVRDPVMADRLAIAPDDSLQIGDSAVLFWHRGKWRRGRVTGYDKDASGKPIAVVGLLEADGLPAETINVGVADRAMREPSKSAKQAADALTIDDMTVEELRALLTDALQKALADSIAEADKLFKSVHASIAGTAGTVPGASAPKERLTVTTKSKGGGLTFKG